MAANPGDLVTLQQALAWLQLTVDANGVVQGLISAVSTKIQNYIGYQALTATYTRTLNGNAGQKMLLPDRPVTAVTALTIDTVTIPLAVPGVSPGYLFDGKFVGLVGYSSWPHGPGMVDRFNRGFQNVSITYTAGWATIPYDIQQACLNWMNSAYGLMGNDPGVGLQKAGDTTIETTNMLTKLDGYVINMPPQVVDALMPYRRVAT